MATPSSESPQPLTLTAPPSTNTSNRRVPPPCWTDDETSALIDSYREKWYSLRRSNLRANHWQLVADSVAGISPPAIGSPAKTSIQCRHKMEKLRKRYRAEIARARSMPVSRINSAWVHFGRMDDMEKGPIVAKPAFFYSGSDDDDHGVDNDDHVGNGVKVDGFDPPMYQNGVRSGFDSKSRSFHCSTSNVGGGNGFRIRLTNGVSIAKPGIDFHAKNYPKFDQNLVRSPLFSSNFGTRVLKDCGLELGQRSGDGDRGGGRREVEGKGEVGEMVSAIKALGDGYVKMERMKMEMARQIETMRMEMEMKRTEMILDSQERIVEAFANGFHENKKRKTMP